MKLTEIEFYPTSLTFQKAVYASEYEDVYVAGNAVDGNASSYFETKKGMWPAYIAVDMGAVYDIKYINIHLPPLMTWEPRTQNIEIQISTEAWSSGMTIDQIHFTTLIEGKDYTFDPATGKRRRLGAGYSRPREIRKARIQVEFLARGLRGTNQRTVGIRRLKRGEPLGHN